MRNMRVVAVSCSLLVLGILSCKKKDDAPPPPAETKVVTPPPPPPVAEVKPLVGEELAKWFVGCWDMWSAGDFAKFEGCYAADAVSTWPDSGVPDMAGAKAIVEGSKQFKAAFADGKGAPQLVLVNGRSIAAVALVTGTHTGPLKGPMGEIPATNKKMGQLVFHMVQVNEKNQVSKEWFVQDMGTMMGQLGLNPMPVRPAMDKGADAPTIIVAKDDDAEKAALALAKKGNEDFMKEDLKAMEASLADDIVELDQSAAADKKGKKDVFAGTKMFLGAMGSIKFDCPNAWAAGPYVVQACQFSAVNDGDMGKEMKKTGKPVAMTVVEINKIEGDKVKEIWRFYNGMAMAAQLGWLDAGPGMPEGGAPKGDMKGDAPKAPAKPNK
jgi:predicted ester cyclase